VFLPGPGPLLLVARESSTAGAQSFNLTAADSLTFSETAAKTAQAFTRTVTETLTFADTAPRAAQAPVRTVTESLSFSESADRATVSRTRPISESLTFSETPARAAQAFSGRPRRASRSPSRSRAGRSSPGRSRRASRSPKPPHGRPGVHADRNGRAHLHRGRDPPSAQSPPNNSGIADVQRVGGRRQDIQPHHHRDAHLLGSRVPGSASVH
jgi:hypothetical protein